jgi:Domain of unknown function (DUF6378)
MELDDMLAEASCLIHGDRQEQYGDIHESWERIGRLWSALLDLDYEIPAHMVGVMLASMKLSRIAGSPEHTDSYIDALAYIAGAGELATK